MKRLILIAAFAFAAPLLAQDGAAPSPNEIVAAAPAGDWVAIEPKDLLVMDLAPDAAGDPRRVVIQLMPPPFSQGWVENIRTLAQAHWWDGTSVYRVQDNYVVQWGDLSEQKPLPEGLKVVPESEYAQPASSGVISQMQDVMVTKMEEFSKELAAHSPDLDLDLPPQQHLLMRLDPYSAISLHYEGWPVAMNPNAESQEWKTWPVHCYGMVGVARDLSPSTGNGADLYAVIGHAPRHLDRNIALVGRVIEGIEHLSSLPRGKAEAGFYGEDEAEKRVPILSVRLGNEVAQSPSPSFEYLSTESESFAAYAEARANRRDPFFITPAGDADICNVPVPVRRAPAK